MLAGGRKNRFSSLHRKGFISLSLLLLVLGMSFSVLNYWNLRKQFAQQQDAASASLQAEFRGLVNRSADRLERLGIVFASLGEFQQLVAAPRNNGNGTALGGFIDSVRYELDVETLAFFDSHGDAVWRWSSGQVMAIPGPRLREVLRQVREQESPVSVLACHAGCSLYTFVPMLAAGGNNGVLALSQMITDVVLDFAAVSGTDVAVLLPAADGPEGPIASWQLRLAALSNPQRLEPFLQHVASRYSGPETIDKDNWLDWKGRKYTVSFTPLSRILKSEPGYILFISDITASAKAVRQASQESLLLIGASLTVAEIILLILLREPLRRIKHLAATLPMLEFGNFREVGESLKHFGPRETRKDEIDVLYSMSITLARKIEEQRSSLASERDFIRGLLDNAQVLILTETRDGKIHTVNELAAGVLGRGSEALQGARFIDLIEIGHQDETEIRRGLDKLFSNRLHRFEHEAMVRAGDGQERHIVWVHTRLLDKEHHSAIAVLSIGLDATARVEAESRMRWLANHDPLTGLKNRMQFRHELEQDIAQVEHLNTSSALLVFDLDYFKDINDSSGHAAGDALLSLLANELRSRARKSDVLARLGGDEFAVLMPDTAVDGAERFAVDLNKRLMAHPFQFGDRSFRISASIGIALIPDDGTNVEELMANADTAMYQAKKAGRGRFHVFSHLGEERHQVSHRAYWRGVIAESLAERRLFFHYQPVIDLASGRVAYCEALLRLILKDGRLVFPGEYMDVILRSDLMNAIDQYVIEEALRILGGDEHARLSVNLSARALADSKWVEPLKQAVRKGSIKPQSLILEITETAAIADLDTARRLMSELAELGFRFALDDFGSGFASFHYLRHLPIQHVKIDRSFVSRLAEDERDEVFVSALTTLAHGYQQQVVAEGVENAETLARLRELGVDLAQGFFLGRPDPVLKRVNEGITVAPIPVGGCEPSAAIG